ncbi:hypothetical protein DIS18_09975 [Algibacter marinivivus]|uniref:Lipoprotein n=1 Tax=Algibacter marinivivus TaxID=2100723 RepID=A0A2U2X485_9FLAO|nr:hypothetical protein [Algibacter marinivivus]PWH82564.1 hypothetical protein DIS18_09975 [Algibacter marinivivus]
MKTFTLLIALLSTSLCSAQYISEDDKLHFGAGFLISGGTYTIVYSKTKNKKKAFWYSFAASTLVGLSKEIYDGYIIDGGRFDNGEMVATSLGGLTASTTLHLFVGKKNNEKLKNIAIVN